MARLVTITERREMRRRRYDGQTLREISKALGKPRGTVYEHVKDIIWPPPSGGHSTKDE